MEKSTIKEKENQRITVSILIPLLFVCLLWLTYFIEYASGKDFSILGILPRTISGLPGIVFTPFLHGSFSHLISNSVPLLVLGFGLIYFYRNIAYKIFLLIWVIDGLGVWLLGREAYHIGASGLVYGMTSFLIFSGVLRKNRHLLALAMVIIFVYGSLVWGMFPYIPDVSWEAHLFGFLAGVYFSVHYLLDGPPNDPVPEWMNEDEEEMAENDENNAIDVQQNEEKFSQQKDINVRYTYIPTKTKQ